jgi:hypothetical protein
VQKVRVVKVGVLFIHVEGESPFSTDLRGLGVWCSGTFGWRARDVYRCTLSGGAPHSAAPLKAGDLVYRLVPRKSLGPMWCSSFPRLIPLR